MQRNVHARWKGKASDGQGTLTGPSTVLKQTPYSVESRFENVDGKAGTNPEELLAAAHASCFTMSVGHALEHLGYVAEALDASVTVLLDQVEGGLEISRIELDLEATVPGISVEEFEETVELAKTICPVNRPGFAVDSKI